MSSTPNLSLLLPQDHIICGLPADHSKKQVITTLAKPLLKDGIITDLDAFLHAIEHRERRMNTLVDEWIAFPHATAPEVCRLGLSVGTVAPPGCIYDAYTQKTCRLLFLIAIPDAEPCAHLPLLTQVVGTLMDMEKRKKLLSPDVTVGGVRRLLCGKSRNQLD